MERCRDKGSWRLLEALIHPAGFLVPPQRHLYACVGSYLEGRRAGSQPQPQLQIGKPARPHCSHQRAIRSKARHRGFLGLSLCLWNQLPPGPASLWAVAGVGSADTQAPSQRSNADDTRKQRAWFQSGFQPCWLCTCHLHKGPSPLRVRILFFPK